MEIIKVERLFKKFKESVVVDNISFSVKSGEKFAFLGPNGAGKSTTIGMLTTTIKRSGGDVFLGGFDPDDNPYEARKLFGIVFQDDSHDEDLTAYENLLLHAILYNVPKKDRDQKIKEALEFVDLFNRAKDKVRTFSGGLKRRLEIARALLHEPKILFLDEPTLGLDPQTRKHLWDFVTRLCSEKGMTVFFTTHYMQEAENFADRIAIIDHGKIIEIGTLAEIKQKTQTKTLEEAFLKLTGIEIRNQEADPMSSFKKRRR